MGRVVALILILVLASSTAWRMPPHPGDGPAARVKAAETQPLERAAALSGDVRSVSTGRVPAPPRIDEGETLAAQRTVEIEVHVLDPELGTPIDDAIVEFIDPLEVGFTIGSLAHPEESVDDDRDEPEFAVFTRCGGVYRASIESTALAVVVIRRGKRLGYVRLTEADLTAGSVVRVITELGQFPDDAAAWFHGFEKGPLAVLDDVSNGLDDAAAEIDVHADPENKPRERTPVEAPSRSVEINTVDATGRSFPHAEIRLRSNEILIVARRFTRPGIREPIPRTDAHGGGFFSPVPLEGEIEVTASFGKHVGRATFDASMSVVTVVLADPK